MNPFCFLHIPRTAGTTLNKILLDNFKPEEVLSLYTDSDFVNFKEISQDHLEKIKLIQGHILLQEYDPPRIYSRDVRVFTFLREPIARLHSEYYFLKTWKHSHMYSIIHGRNISFSEYITSDLKEVVYKGKNFMTRVLSGVDLTSSEACEKALSLAKKNLERVFVAFGIQELFDESLVLLARQLGLRNIFYEKRNVLDDKSKSVISDLDYEVATLHNQWDIKLYDFAVGLFNEKISSGGAALRREIEVFEKVNEKMQNVCNLINRRDGLVFDGGIQLPKA
ncbi:MAG: sulfotransferase family 2 domain-containing protein [Acidobacteriota bacterium]